MNPFHTWFQLKHGVSGTGYIVTQVIQLVDSNLLAFKNTDLSGLENLDITNYWTKLSIICCLLHTLISIYCTIGLFFSTLVKYPVICYHTFYKDTYLSVLYILYLQWCIMLSAAKLIANNAPGQHWFWENHPKSKLHHSEGIGELPKLWTWKTMISERKYEGWSHSLLLSPFNHLLIRKQRVATKQN